jgi:hypothetical protein
MYKIIDEFLSKEDFNLFTAITKQNSSLWQSHYSRKLNFWTKTVLDCQSEDFEVEVNLKLSPMVWKVATLIKNHIQQEIRDLPPLFSIGYLFQKHPYKVNYHFDRIYQDQKYYKPEYVADSYIAFFYGHTEWDPNWGGFLTFLDGDCAIEPKPNRLVFYSCNEMHQVTQINSVKENPIRKVFKLSFFNNTQGRQHPALVKSLLNIKEEN